jgi:hypothetical protein
MKKKNSKSRVPHVALCTNRVTTPRRRREAGMQHEKWDSNSYKILIGRYDLRYKKKWYKN